jgi:phosphoadenosine phosphosulfate reductase
VIDEGSGGTRPRSGEHGKVWSTIQMLEQDAQVHDLCNRFADADPLDVIEASLRELFPGRIAVVSSFGAESAVLLALIAEVDPATPVIFLDSEKLFPETLEYRDILTTTLGLTDVRVLHPSPADLRADDPNGALHATHPDLCCHIRKTLPLVRGLRGFDAWVSGRKRFHGGERANLALFEFQGGRVKVNPLALWSQARLAEEMQRRALPVHGLVPYGYLSIGCMPCTTAIKSGEGARDGRWRAQEKTECGIHFDPNGRVVRASGST